MTFFCNKCGYSGPTGPYHQLRVIDAPCPYLAAELPPLSDEERKRIAKEFGLQDSTEQGGGQA